MSTPLTRENLMAAYQGAVGAGEQPRYVIVGSFMDEKPVRDFADEMRLNLRIAYDRELGPGGWVMV